MTYTEPQLRTMLDVEFEPWGFISVLENGIIEYQPSKDELGWLDFVRGRYAIADALESGSEEDDDGTVTLTIDTYEMSRALEDDGAAPKAVCLSDDTVLQAICFYGYVETDGE